MVDILPGIRNHFGGMQPAFAKLRIQRDDVFRAGGFPEYVAERLKIAEAASFTQNDKRGR